MILNKLDQLTLNIRQLEGMEKGSSLISLVVRTTFRTTEKQSFLGTYTRSQSKTGAKSAGRRWEGGMPWGGGIDCAYPVPLNLIS